MQEEEIALPFYSDKTDMGHVVAETVTLLFESQPKPVVAQAEANLPIYLANIPLNAADPKLNVIILLTKIRDEIFPVESRDALSRLSVVVGINRRMSLVNDVVMPIISAEDANKLNQLPFHVVIISFLWKPSFSFTQSGLANIESEYNESFQMCKSWCDANPKARSKVAEFEAQEIKLSMIPYGEIRHTIAVYYSTQKAGFELRQRFKGSPLYFLMLDADVKSLKLKNSENLLQYYEKQLHKLGDQRPTLLAGGFQIDPREGFMQSRFADFVLSIQSKIAEILPRGIYYSETNCLIYLPENNHSLIEPFSPGRGEMKGLVQQLLKRQNPRFIFDSNAAITTTLPIRMKKDFHGFDDNGKFVGWMLSDITHLRGISQSPLKPMSWAHMIYDALPKVKIEGDEKAKNIRTNVSSLLSKLFNTVDPFSVLIKALAEEEINSPHSVVEKLNKIIIRSKKYVDLKDFVLDNIDFRSNYDAICKIYGNKISKIIYSVLNLTRQAITEFVENVFCLNPEENVDFIAGKGLKGIDKAALRQHKDDIYLAVKNGQCTKSYLYSNITDDLTRMHVLVAFDDFDVIEEILNKRKWKEIPNKANNSGVTPFTLALMKGHVDIAILYMIKKEKLMDELDAKNLMIRDQWERSLLHAAAVLEKGAIFEEILGKCLAVPNFEVLSLDIYGNSVYDRLIQSGLQTLALNFYQMMLRRNQVQIGVNSLDDAILRGNYQRAMQLVELYEEEPSETLDANSVSHLTSMETCFYLCSNSPQQIWPIIIKLLDKSSKRIFYLINSKGQNIFHLCAQRGRIDDFNKLFGAFSKLINEMEAGLNNGESLEYYKQHSRLFKSLLKTLDYFGKSPLTYLIDRCLGNIDRELFSAFLLFENMKAKKPNTDIVSANGIPYLLSKIAKSQMNDLIYIVKICIKYDREFLSAVFNYNGNKESYFSILIRRDIRLPYQSIQMLAKQTVIDDDELQNFFELNEREWGAQYSNFEIKYLEYVNQCEELGDDCYDDYDEDEEEDEEDAYEDECEDEDEYKNVPCSKSVNSLTRSAGFGQSPEDSDPDYVPSSEQDNSAIPVVQKRSRSTSPSLYDDVSDSPQEVKTTKETSDTPEQNETPFYQAKFHHFWKPSSQKRQNTDPGSNADDFKYK